MYFTLFYNIHSVVYVLYSTFFYVNQYGTCLNINFYPADTYTLY